MNFQMSEAEQLVGEVYSVSGSQAGVRLTSGNAALAPAVTVGALIGIVADAAKIIGVVTTVVDDGSHRSGKTALTVDLLGEIKPDGLGNPTYRRGVTAYPSLGSQAVTLGRENLDLIFGAPGEATIRVGQLHQDASTEARLKLDDLLTKHFAVLGSTGVGKSSGVAVIIDEIIKAKPDLRLFFVDPHSEYGHSFPGQAHVLNPRNLKLPFWLFNFEEFVDVLFRGRPGLEDETDILAELIPVARSMFSVGRQSSDRSALKRADAKLAGITVDTPIPFRMADLIALIEDRRGKLENRSLVFNHTRLLSRMEAVRTDPRYSFMFDSASLGGDTMVDVIGDLFRLPANGKPITIMQLAGFPAEVVDSVVSVVCRMAFELGLWSDGSLPLLVLCEEAHRYAPADRTIGFGPTRKALSRIAKEGRKYGVYLGLVTQRPAELDPTIVSQCSTVLAMRMPNDRDQAILRAAVSDAAATLLSFVPSLGTREAFGFGEAMPLPTRLRFKELPEERIPRSESVHARQVSPGEVDGAYLAQIVERWRGVRASPLEFPEDILARTGPVAPVRAEPREVLRRHALPDSGSDTRLPHTFGVRR